MNDFLPDGWEEEEVDQLVTYKKGKKPQRLEVAPFDNSVPYLDIKALETSIVDQYAEIESSNLADENDLLVVWDGSRSGLISLGQTGAIGSTIMSVRPILINKLYFYYFLQSQYEVIQSQRKGVGIPHVDPTVFGKLILPIAPLSEQQRIVAIVKERMHQVEQSRQQFQKLKSELQQYRKEILISAVSGQLTEDWREEEIFYNDIPYGWEFTNLSDIARISGGITLNANRKEFPLKVDYLRVANVYANRLLLDEIKQVGVTESEKSRTELKKGDLLLVEGNGSIDQIGRVAMWDGSIEPCLHQNHLIRLRLTNEITARYVLLYLLSPLGREKIVEQSASTSGLFNLSLSKISAIEISLPPVEEQNEILKRVAEQMTAADALEASYDEAIAEVETLPQIILAKAFAGELTEQNPNDEPASILLERIRIEREIAKKAPKPVRDQSRRPSEKFNLKLTMDIIEALENNDGKMKSVDLWQASKFRDDIDLFYAALRTEIEVNHTVLEIEDQQYLELTQK